MRWFKIYKKEPIRQRWRACLDPLMGPLNGRQCHDLAVIHAICTTVYRGDAIGAPFDARTERDLKTVINVLTTSTPSAISRGGLSSDSVVTPMMAATALYAHHDVGRTLMAAQIIHALDLSSKMASELLVYADAPSLPRTLLHHLMYSILNLGGDAIPILEGILQGVATGAIAVNVKGGQIYDIDPAFLFMAYPRTLALALPGQHRDDIQRAHEALAAVGLASAIVTATVATPDGEVTLKGFLSRRDVWSDYRSAIQPKLVWMDTATEGRLHIEFTSHPQA